ncbi:MAG: hypothetical protein JWQ59_1742 [Cryobacterium sp.]|jgi:hypothetical protein|nr:hypothetical protein [Cryobacterium sp.]
MTQYLLSMYQPDEGTPPPEFLDKVMADLDVLNQEIRDAGAWVFTGGLHPATSATVLRSQDGEVIMTDGPYLEGKEHLGGFWIVEAPDLDAALEWGRKSTQITGLPTEVRPFQDMGGQ